MLATGLRIGEALGLHWSTVNLESKRLQVRKQLIEIPRQPRRFGEPKSASGKRSVPLIPAAIAALHAQRAKVLQYKVVAGLAWQDQDLVFPTTSAASWSLVVSIASSSPCCNTPACP